VIDRHPVTLGPASFFGIIAPQALTDDYSKMLVLSQAPFTPDDTDNLGDFYMIENALNVQLLSNGVDDPAADVGGSAMSGDGSHVAVQSAPTATPDQPQVYDLTGGQTIKVGFDPAGNEIPALLGGGRSGIGLSVIGAQSEPSAMSHDGSRIFFSDAGSAAAGGAPRQLYVREGGQTTLISEGQGGPRDGQPSDQDVDFQIATPDGAHVFFITTAQLTADATVGGGLYRYDLDTGDLTFLSTGAVDTTAGAQVQGVLRVSTDGSRAYFVANDTLGGEGAVGGPNLYMVDGGGVRFITTLTPGGFPDASDWTGGEGLRTTKATPDASRIVFQSAADLTPDNDGGVTQVYLYDANEDTLQCVSCPPAGVTPNPQGGSLDEEGPTIFLGSIPGDISNDGSTIQFQTADALVPEDSNGQPDVYLWVNGTNYILGTGSNPAPAIIGGMSKDGKDAFFLTRDALVPVDNDGGMYDVYDARVGGGLANQQKVPAAPCEGDACRPSPPPTPFNPPGSVDFNGKGNLEGQAAAFQVKAISAATSRRLARTGKATLLVQVSEAGRVSVRASAKFGKRTRTVGSVSKRAKKAGTVRLRLKLSKAARQRLARTGRLKLTLRVSYSEVSKRATAHLTLRRHAR
jgi:hypothetical protein